MKIRYILYIALCLFAAACDDSDIINNEESTLVVEGWIANDDFPVVMVTTNVMVNTKIDSIQTLEDHIIRYAKVTISDGEKDVVLTGKYDKKYMPPYIYTTTDMVGRVGHKYTLKVEADPYYATAETTILPPVDINSITQQTIESSESQYKLFTEFTDPEGDNYYCMFYKIGAKTAQYNICGVGVFQRDGLSSDVSYPVYKTSNISVQYYNTNDVFNKGDTVCVQLSSIDQQAYNFWSDFQNSSSLSNNFIIPYTTNIRTNINGGYGYWTGFGKSEKWIIVGQRE